MEIDEIIESLEWFDGKFEREAVEAAIARREEITPELLLILEEIADPEQAQELDSEDGYMAHLYAMYLLAQFRETRAYPLMLKIALLPSDLLDSLFSDCITESFDSVFASVCGGDLQGIQSIIENPKADQWVRGAAIGSLANLVAAGVKTREEILEYFASLFHGKLTDKNDVVWSDLVCYSTDLCAIDLLPEIERAFDEGLVDSGTVGLKEVQRDLEKGPDWALERLANNRHRRLIDDTVSEMAGWASFDKEEQHREEQRHKETQRTYLQSISTPQWTEPTGYTGFKRTTPKVGRNDPCPCLSGKKYKKCCGQ